MHLTDGAYSTMYLTLSEDKWVLFLKAAKVEELISSSIVVSLFIKHKR